MSKINIFGRLPIKAKRWGAGILATLGLGGGALWFANSKNETPNPTETTSVSEKNIDNNQGNYNPNSKRFIVDASVELIEEAAKAGKKLDAEDAVLAVIVANADEITNGFMGELFGEPINQTYTYGNLVDAYLRVMMMQVENIGVAKDSETTFNVENAFASLEDYEYLSNIRTLVDSYKNAETKEEKNEIVKKLNEIAFNLCTYETYDISSAASVAAMLSLDGMRIITNNSNNVVLPDDIRDEMFGNGNYTCSFDATYEENGQVFATIYSFRVNDLKLDSVKAKLENAILGQGKNVIIGEIINEVEGKTLNIVISDFDPVEEINKAREENRDVAYAYEKEPGKVKDNYSPITEEDKENIEIVDGEEVIVVPGDTIIDVPETKPEETKPSTEETIPGETNPTESTEPTGPIYGSKEEAEDALEEEVIDAQAEANKGSEDGMNDAKSGKSKRDLTGKSEHYKNAYNASYDAWKKIYDAQHSKEEDIPVETEPEQTEPVTVEETNPTEVTEPVESTEPTEQVVSETDALDGLTLEQLYELQAELSGTVTSMEETFTYTR